MLNYRIKTQIHVILIEIKHIVQQGSRQSKDMSNTKLHNNTIII